VHATCELSRPQTLVNILRAILYRGQVTIDQCFPFSVKLHVSCSSRGIQARLYECSLSGAHDNVASFRPCHRRSALLPSNVKFHVSHRFGGPVSFHSTMPV
jgi:hypothetical protein